MSEAMTIINDHQVQIVNGKIEIRFAGSDLASAAQSFDDDAKAADCLAEEMKRSGMLVLIGTVSCGSPAQFGRPGFHYPKFVEMVMDRLRANGVVTTH